MERLQIKAAVQSPCQTTAALLPLVLASTTAMAQIQAMCGSTPGMALPGFSAVAISMEKRLVTAAALQSPSQETAAPLPLAPWKRRQWHLLGHTRIYQWNGSAWVQIGSDIDGENSDRSGNAVSLSNDGKFVAIGASHNDGRWSYRRPCTGVQASTPPDGFLFCCHQRRCGPRLSSPTTRRSLQQQKRQHSAFGVTTDGSANAVTALPSPVPPLNSRSPTPSKTIDGHRCLHRSIRC